MFLSQEEMIELTGCQRQSAQLRALRFMGIEHRQRADGSLVVLRGHVEQAMGLRAISEKADPSKKQKNKPNWGAI